MFCNVSISSSELEDEKSLSKFHKHLKILDKIYHAKTLTVYYVGVVHLDMKSNGMLTQEFKKGLKGTVMVSLQHKDSLRTTIVTLPLFLRVTFF